MPKRAAAADNSLPAKRMARVLEPLKDERRLTEQICLDNRPERTSDVLSAWCENNDIGLAYIQKGKPQQNGFTRRFNG